MAWILDLDGVVWLSERPVEGSRQAIERLRRAGERVLFLTNNSSPSSADLVSKLVQMGIEAEADDLVTSAMAAATLVEPGSTALVCAGDGVVEALNDRDVRIVEEAPADFVVVGFTRRFDYELLAQAFRAVHGGAHLIGTNDDPTYPTPDGPIPGGGSLLAAVATAAGVEPEVAGKPYQPMARLVRQRLGVDPENGAVEGVLVGDRPSTDGLMARRLHLPFALVMSGVTKKSDLPADPVPEYTEPALASLVDDEGQLRGQ